MIDLNIDIEKNERKKTEALVNSIPKNNNHAIHKSMDSTDYNPAILPKGKLEEKIFYNSTDNIKLCGLLSKVNDNANIVILCHGLKADKTERNSFSKLVELLQQHNINSFRFDFRGHGESTGKDYEMTPLKEVEDLESTIKMLENKNYNNIFLLGASFGASIISLLDTDKFKSVKGLISWYGCLDYFATIEEDHFFSDEHMQVAKEKGYYEIVSKRTGKSFKLGINLYNEIHRLVPYEYLIDKDIPILFVHGTKDRMIPHSLSKKINALCKNSSLELIENGDHTFDNDPNVLYKACDVTIQFIKNNIAS